MTTTPTTNPKGNPNTTGVNDADAKAKEKAALEAEKQKKRRRKQKEKKEKKNNNNNNKNYVKFDGLITNGIMEEVIISPGSSARMTSDFRIFKKSAAVYVVAKGYRH